VKNIKISKFNMQQIILNIEESRYALFLQFMKTLDYVRVVSDTSNVEVVSKKSKLIQEKKRPKFGSAQGMFVMTPAFDEPIDGFEEYMNP
jgi:hypothetical protein